MKRNVFFSRFSFWTMIPVFVCVAVLPAEEMRTWTDSSGAFTIEASLVRFEGRTVRLKKEDGKTLSLTIDKLSKADQLYLTEGASSGNPFEAAEQAASGDLAVDIRSAKEIGDYGDRNWSCPADPPPLVNLSSKRFTFRPGDIPLHSHSKENGFFFSRNGERVLYALQVPKPAITNRGEREVSDSTRIFLGDVASGETTMIRHPLCLTPYGLSPDGNKAMFVQSPWGFGIHTGQKGKIHIVKCAAGRLEPFIILNPIGNQNERLRNQESADVEGAVWVSNDHILVFYSARLEGLLVLVNINTGKALWRLKLGFGSEKSLTLSPGGKYFLVNTGNAVLLIETAAGKTIGTLEGAGKFGGEKYAFSPDGQKIASCGDEMIRIWDATTGELEEAFFINGANVFSKFAWVTHQHLFVENRVVDTTLQAPIWEYAGNLTCIHSFGGQLWYMTPGAGARNDARTLVGVNIPQKRVLDQFSGDQNSRDLFAVQPGMAVALKLDPSISRDHEEIRRAMEEKLRANELTLADNAPVTFLLKVTPEGEKPVTYTIGPFSMNRGGTEVKFQQEKYQLLVQQGDQTLWSRISVTGPPDVSLDDIANTSLQAVVHRKVQERQYKGWFLRLNIPKKIPKMDKIGKSTLNEIGLSDD